jgi:hypothetical protein
MNIDNITTLENMQDIIDSWGLPKSNKNVVELVYKNCLSYMENLAKNCGSTYFGYEFPTLVLLNILITKMILQKIPDCVVVRAVDKPYSYIELDGLVVQVEINSIKLCTTICLDSDHSLDLLVTQISDEIVQLALKRDNSFLVLHTPLMLLGMRCNSKNLAFAWRGIVIDKNNFQGA